MRADHEVVTGPEHLANESESGPASKEFSGHQLPVNRVRDGLNPFTAKGNQFIL